MLFETALDKDASMESLIEIQEGLIEIQEGGGGRGGDGVEELECGIHEKF